ncbi:MAG: DUF350 domain-containing protein [Planctomycetota bacterium]
MEYVVFIFRQYAVTLGWAITGAISMGLGLAIGMKIFTWLTPKIDEIEELKKGNIAVGIVLAGLILAIAAVVAITVMPETVH